LPGRRPPVHLMWRVFTWLQPQAPVTACRVPPAVLAVLMLLVPVLVLPVVVPTAEPLPEPVLAAETGALIDPGKLTAAPKAHNSTFRTGTHQPFMPGTLVT
jgi:hypothetical protein